MQVKLTIGERLKDLRVERKLTLEQLAAEVGISKSALGKYESDNGKDISPYSILVLADYYGVSCDYLMGRTETKNHPNTALHELHLGDAYVLVFKLSRFARNTSDTAKYLQELSSYGIGLLGIKDGIDTSTVTGKMIANIMGAVAEVELENIHEQTLAGRQQKARNGLWNGAQAPFGYSLKDKKLMIYQKEAETVKEIFRLYTEEGQSISYIAKKLNDENIQREQRGNVKISGFTDRTVRIILSNPVYAGMISYGRRHTVKVEGKNNETKVVKQDDESKIILVDGVHEPIVSKETFAKAAERLKKNVAHRKTRSDSTTVYPLTGLIRCPDCGKNIFGYTAPPRKKKNGKEGYYPRYISYRCISGRDRNGISCSLANKYYSGTKLETEVKEVISSMVTIPEFVELISQKIDIQTDVNSLRKKQTAIRNEITKYNGNLLQTEKRLTELDIADRHYQNKVDSLNRILDDLYEKIEDAQTRLDEVDQEIAMVEKSAMTKKSIFEMLEGFSKYYDVMSPEDKKALLQAMVSFIELYPEKRDDKHLIKTIHFTFPVTYDGESGALFVRTNEQHVEAVLLLTKLNVERHIEVDVSIEELDVTAAESKATYNEIRDYVLAHHQLKVSNLYIAQVKQKYGIIERESYHKAKNENAKQPECPKEKEDAIVEALKHFQMI